MRCGDEALTETRKKVLSSYGGCVRLYRVPKVIFFRRKNRILYIYIHFVFFVLCKCSKNKYKVLLLCFLLNPCIYVGIVHV